MRRYFWRQLRFGLVAKQLSEKNHTIRVPLPTSYVVDICRDRQDKTFPYVSIRYVVTLGGQTNKFFSSFLPLTILVYSSIQVDTGILVHPILIDTENRDSGGRGGNSREVYLDH